MKHIIVSNNNPTKDELIRLIGLKTLFARQLPKMPRDYIVRLVFDRRHTSLCLLEENVKKNGDEDIIGGICYRAYPDMKFAEIAFCAVSGNHQVKGYGTKLMNLVKGHVAQQGIEYFITYADNYAIGYFKKQGFSKSIAMPKTRYQGLIKDYDGGTPMECYIHPNLDYTRIPEMIAAQRDFILEQVRKKSKSHVRYPPIQNSAGDTSATNVHGHAVTSRNSEAAARAMAIPGVMEAGWTMADLQLATGAQKDADRQRNHLKSELLAIIRKIEEQQFAWPFREPVDTQEVPDYLEVIKNPIVLSTIEKHIRKGDHYTTKSMLLIDLMLMVNNCKAYNDPSSPYYEAAVSLQEFVQPLFPLTTKS